MHLDGHLLVEEAKRAAARLGLSFAAAVPLSECADPRYGEWLSEGRHGEMSYLESQRLPRLDPVNGFAPFRSCIAFIAEYDLTPPSPSVGTGNIARYALGDDYHDVLKRRLHEILDGLRWLDPDLRGRALVDTAPLLEKLAAERAGLGWRGKHTNLLREDRGSFFFLGEILVDRDVPPSIAAKDRCGICDACITACPTRAIVAPYLLDARRCISYLTIEKRGEIPKEFRRAIGNRIFGCDDCQEVCPWNRFATESPIKEFRARPGLRDRTIAEWLVMDEETWRGVFRRSAVKRTKFTGFMRNVAVAAGNAGDPTLVPAIRSVLDRRDPLVRGHLYWALGELGGAEARHVLENKGAPEDDVFAGNERRDALARMDKGEAP